MSTADFPNMLFSVLHDKGHAPTFSLLPHWEHGAGSTHRQLTQVLACGDESNGRSVHYCSCSADCI